jgi:hypothetical protein
MAWGPDHPARALSRAILTADQRGERLTHDMRLGVSLPLKPGWRQGRSAARSEGAAFRSGRQQWRGPPCSGKPRAVRPPLMAAGMRLEGRRAGFWVVVVLVHPATGSSGPGGHPGAAAAGRGDRETRNAADRSERCVPIVRKCIGGVGAGRRVHPGLAARLALGLCTLPLKPGQHQRVRQRDRGGDGLLDRGRQRWRGRLVAPRRPAPSP